MYTLIVSLLAAIPEMTILLTLVMPSEGLAPVSGLMPMMVGDRADQDVVAGLDLGRRPAPRVQWGAVRVGDDGRGLRGRGRAVEAQAQGVIPRAERRRVGTLHLDVEPLARGDVGNAHRERSCRTGRPRWRSPGPSPRRRRRPSSSATSRLSPRLCAVTIIVPLVPAGHGHGEEFRLAGRGDVEVGHHAGERASG